MPPMEQPTSPASVALVVGITGMAGLSLAEALKKATAPGAPWTVYGAARRSPPTWFPPSAVDKCIEMDALDAGDTCRALSPLSPQVTHVFWVALASCDTEEANIATNSAMLANVLSALLTNPKPSLRHVTLQTGTKHYMGPFAINPADANQIAPLELPFREDRPRLPNPNFYYALEDLVASYSHKLTWSVHRSSIILGASSRSIYNCLLSLAVYALLCRRERTPFMFPGSGYSWEHFCDASDAGLLADQQIWAATTSAAKNQAFNCTNGDVFTWRSFWRVLAEEFDVEFVPFSPGAVTSSWPEQMKRKGPVWDSIIEEFGLLKTTLEEITCFDAVYAVLNFRFQHVCSMNKSREFGFYGFVDTLKSIRKWVAKLREMNIIPQVEAVF